MKDVLSSKLGKNNVVSITDFLLGNDYTKVESPYLPIGLLEELQDDNDATSVESFYTHDGIDVTALVEEQDSVDPKALECLEKSLKAIHRMKDLLVKRREILIEKTPEDKAA